MHDSRAGRHGADALFFLELLLLADELRLKRGEQDHVGVFLGEPGGALVQLQGVPVIGRKQGIFNSDDLRVCRADDDHPALVAQCRQAAEQLCPEVLGLDVALAVAGLFDRRYAQFAACAFPHQRLQPVERVQHASAVGVRFLVERADGLEHVFESRSERESRHIDRAQAVFGLDDDRRWRRAGKGRFAHAGVAVNDDARRLAAVVCDGCQGYGHVQLLSWVEFGSCVA